MAAQDYRPVLMLVPRDGGDAVPKLVGEIDLSTAPPLLEELVAFAAGIADDRLVIDCSDLEFIDSTGLSAAPADQVRTNGGLAL